MLVPIRLCFLVVWSVKYLIGHYFRLIEFHVRYVFYILKSETSVFHLYGLYRNVTENQNRVIVIGTPERLLYSRSRTLDVGILSYNHLTYECQCLTKKKILGFFSDVHSYLIL